MVYLLLYLGDGGEYVLGDTGGGERLVGMAREERPDGYAVPDRGGPFPESYQASGRSSDGAGGAFVDFHRIGKPLGRYGDVIRP